MKTNKASLTGYTWGLVLRELFTGRMSLCVTGRNTGWYLLHAGPGLCLTVHLGGWVGWRPEGQSHH